MKKQDFGSNKETKNPIDIIFSRLHLKTTVGKRVATNLMKSFHNGHDGKQESQFIAPLRHLHEALSFLHSKYGKATPGSYGNTGYQVFQPRIHNSELFLK